jgi:hypothetical protein
MPEPFTVKLIHDDLTRSLRARPDLGVGKAIFDCVLESKNPFEEKAIRVPQKWFVLWMLLALLGIACFLYFAGLQ